MKLKPETIQTEGSKLQSIIENLKSAALEKDELIAQLRHQLSVLRVARFGRKTEKYSEGQLGLFDEAELDVSDKEPESEEETVVVKNKAKNPGRKPLPKSYPLLKTLLN